MPSSARKKKTLFDVRENYEYKIGHRQCVHIPMDEIQARATELYCETATNVICTLSLHDALPIWLCLRPTLLERISGRCCVVAAGLFGRLGCRRTRSEEHTSELQSHVHHLCRLLLEKKKHYLMCVKTMSIR